MLTLLDYDIKSMIAQILTFKRYATMVIKFDFLDFNCQSYKTKKTVKLQENDFVEISLTVQCCKNTYMCYKRTSLSF